MDLEKARKKDKRRNAYKIVDCVVADGYKAELHPMVNLLDGYRRDGFDILDVRKYTLGRDDV